MFKDKTPHDVFIEGVLSSENISETKSIIEKLTPDPTLNDDLMHFFRDGKVETRGVVHWLAKQIKPKKYLEIGVRRGWSTAMVASTNPDCDIYAFDEWHENYSGSPNPGPDFVRNEMKKVGYEKEINFYSGNSHVTLSKFFSEQRQDILFDLILVDGDHSPQGGWQDLIETFPYISVGGVLIFDDIQDEALYPVWKIAEDRYRNFKFFSFYTYRPGVGFAVREY